MIGVVLGGLCCVALPFCGMVLGAFLWLMRRSASAMSDTFASPPVAPFGPSMAQASPDVDGFGAGQWGESPPDAMGGYPPGHTPPGGYGPTPGYGPSGGYGPPSGGYGIAHSAPLIDAVLGASVPRHVHHHHHHGHRPAAAPRPGGIFGSLFGGGSSGHKKSSFHSKPSSFKRSGGAKKKW